MPWVEVNGTDIYYQEEGRGRPLVFLHGNSSCGEAWFQQFAAFRCWSSPANSTGRFPRASGCTRSCPALSTA